MRLALTELEDRLLCMADEEWMPLGTARAVLEDWFAASLSLKEVGRLLSTLLEHRLVICTVILQPVHVGEPRLPDDLDLVRYKATAKGIKYLSENNG